MNLEKRVERLEQVRATGEPGAVVVILRPGESYEETRERAGAGHGVAVYLPDNGRGEAR